VARRSARKPSRPRPPAGGQRAGSHPAAVAAQRDEPHPGEPVARPVRASWSAAVLVPALGVVLLTLVAYLPALTNGFVWDDDDYVTANATLRSLAGLGRIWLEPGAVPQYYPLTFTSLWLNYQIGGLDPFGYHLANVLLHAANAVLAALALGSLSIPGAWLAAALFAVHPVHVESVAWVSERKNVLSGVLYLGALLAYLRFLAADRRATAWLAGAGGTSPATRVAIYVLSLALFGAGLLAKTVVCTLPAAILLIIWWKRGRVSIRDVALLSPFFALGAGLAFVTIAMERQHVGAVGGDWDLSFAERCLIAGRAVWFYLGKLFWPGTLTFIYPRWTLDLSSPWQLAFPVGVLAAAGALFALAPRTGRGPLVALLFFVATLGPALGFVNAFPMRYSFVADHFQYLASLGPIALGAALATTAARRLGVGRVGEPARAIAIVAAGALLVVLAILTARQARSYRDLPTLWTDTLAKNPDAWMAHNNLGLLLLEAGDVAPAMEHFRAAIAVKPDDAFARNNLGRALAAQGRLPEAVTALGEAVHLEPANAEAWSNLGNALAQQGRYPEAIGAYQRAIQSRPRFADPHSNLGNVLFLTGRTDDAIASYTAAVRLDPGFADAHQNLGIALAAAGRLPEAEAHLAEAVRLRPTRAEPHYQLGVVLAREGRRAEAAASLREALRLSPQWTEAERELQAVNEGAGGGEGRAVPAPRGSAAPSS